MKTAERRLLERAVGIGVIIAALLASRRLPLEPTDLAEQSVGYHPSRRQMHKTKPDDEKPLVGAPSRDDKRWRRFFAFWLLPMALLMAASTISAIVLWPEGFSSDHPDSVKGGLLVFVSRDLRHGYGSSVSVQSKIWDLDHDGAMLAIKLSFDHGSAGRRFYVVVSGQYQLDSQADLSLFCMGPTLGIRDPNKVRCSDISLGGAEAVEYRFDDQLGAKVNAEIWDVIDTNGYDAPSAGVITGIIRPNPFDDPVQLYVPIKAPVRHRLGSTEYRAFAPIAIGDNEGGSSHRLRDLPTEFADYADLYYDNRDGVPIENPKVVQADFSLREQLGTRQIQWSNPPANPPNSLHWTQDQQGIAGVEIQTSDPFNQNSLSQRSFIAGVAVSVAAAALLLLIERLLQTWSSPSGRPDDDRR